MILSTQTLVQRGVWEHMTVTATCAYCGRKFTYPLPRHETFRRKYCSVGCIGMATAAAMKDKKEKAQLPELWWQK